MSCRSCDGRVIRLVVNDGSSWVKMALKKLQTVGQVPSFCFFVDIASFYELGGMVGSYPLAL